MGTSGRDGPIDRASPSDVMTLATDVGPAPMHVGAVLLFGSADSAESFAAPRMVEAITRRSRHVPRLRQRLLPVPLGCGRPIWVDDPDFDVTRHVHTVACPAPGDEDALLDLAADILAKPLPRERPLWSATVVTWPAGHRAALIVVLHHVLADGIGGLAVLGALVDGAAPVDVAVFPRPRPATGRLAIDAARGRVRAVARLPAGLRRLRTAAAELRPATAGTAVRCSLNRPTGPRRRLAVVRADLYAVRDAAHAVGATVNDVVLTAIAGALHDLLESRGEEVDRFVVSVPVSARRKTSSAKLGNQVGVMPVGIPATGDPQDRLAVTAAATRAGKSAPRGVSTALIAPAFRVLAGLGIFRWFIDRQRLVHTFVTTLRGPDAQLTLAGTPITGVLALSVSPGNVTVSFAVLSYDGTLAITVAADPDTCPDLSELADALDRNLGDDQNRQG
jgi:diacylglycerol O-acyltransferase